MSLTAYERKEFKPTIGDRRLKTFSSDIWLTCFSGLDCKDLASVVFVSRSARRLILVYLHNDRSQLSLLIAIAANARLMHSLENILQQLNTISRTKLTTCREVEQKRCVRKSTAASVMGRLASALPGSALIGKGIFNLTVKASALSAKLASAYQMLRMHCDPELWGSDLKTCILDANYVMSFSGEKYSDFLCNELQQYFGCAKDFCYTDLAACYENRDNQGFYYILGGAGLLCLSYAVYQFLPSNQCSEVPMERILTKKLIDVVDDTVLLNALKNILQMNYKVFNNLTMGEAIHHLEELSRIKQEEIVKGIDRLPVASRLRSLYFHRPAHRVVDFPDDKLNPPTERTGLLSGITVTR